MKLCNGTKYLDTFTINKKKNIFHFFINSWQLEVRLNCRQNYRVLERDLLTNRHERTGFVVAAAAAVAKTAADDAAVDAAARGCCT